MKTELQYHLQKARALATELRSTLEELGRFSPTDTEEFLDFCNDAGTIEDFLDTLTETDPDLVGEGSVRITVEPFA